VLDVPAPGAGGTVRLGELGPDCWQRFGDKRCHEFADAICRTLSRRRSKVADLRLPPLPPKPLDQLAIGSHCLGRLRSLAWMHDVSSLSGQKLGVLLAIPRFGVVCLLDLLCALETPPAPPPERRASKLEDHFDALVPEDVSSWHRGIVMRLLGWDGAGGATLEAIGSEEGRTRERIRQITVPVVARIRAAHPQVLWLSPALELALRLAPVSADDLAGALAARRLARRPFHPAGLLTACELLGREAGFRLDRHGGGLYVVPSAFPPERAVRRAAHALCAGTNMVALERLREAVGIPAAPPADRWLREILGSARYRPADSRSALYRSSAKYSTVESAVRRLLSVVRELPLEDLYLAAEKARRGAPMSSREAFRTVVASVPGVRIRGSAAQARALPDWRKVVRGAERVLVETLRDEGPYVSFFGLRARLRRAGYTDGRTASLLRHSPLVRAYGRGIHGLPGLAGPASRDDVGLAPPTLPRPDGAWLPERGRGWLRWTPSRNRPPGEIPVAASMCPYLPPQLLVFESGEPRAVCGCAAGRGRISGTAHLLRRVGTLPGSAMLVFDAARGRAVFCDAGTGLELGARLDKAWRELDAACAAPDEVGAALVAKLAPHERFAQVPRPREVTPPGLARFAGAVYKVLSVAGRIGLPELREAVSRNLAYRGLPGPGLDEVRDLCSRLPGIRVSDDAATAEPGALPDVLSNGERLLLEALAAQGTLLPRERLIRLCRDRGTSEKSLRLRIERSPVLRRWRPGLYGPVGAPLPLPVGADESGLPAGWWSPPGRRPTVGKGRLLLAAGDLPGGKAAWFAWRLTRGALVHGQLTVPAEFYRRLPPLLKVRDAEGRALGVVCRQKDKLVLGRLRRFLRRQGCLAGDVVLLEVEFARGSAVFRKGDVRLLQLHGLQDGDPQEG